MKKEDTAVVVLSGGQDSVTCLGLALRKHQRILAIAFNYGQRHRVELECAKDICDRQGVPLRIVDLPMLPKLVTSALTGEGDVGAEHPNKPGLPASFVPARNALFLTLAHAYAQEHEARFVYTGVCQTDFSGYPDCRAEFIWQLNLALNTGYESQIRFETPMMQLNKAETFALASRVGFLDVVIHDSHTCYNGDRNTVHKWGRGCGECPACKLRAAGYQKFVECDFNAELVELVVAG